MTDRQGGLKFDPDYVIELIYVAWRAQNIDTVLAHCTPGICYVVHEPLGVSGVGGCMLGKDEVRRFLAANFGTWEFIEVKQGKLQAEGAHYREHTWFRARHRRTGELLEGFKRHVWTFENGLVSECQEFQDGRSIRAFLNMVEPNGPVGRGHCRSSSDPQ